MIGICIKYFHENYGGMLQAFATTKMLEKKGIEYEIIRYEKKKSLKFIIKSLPRLFNKVLINDKYELFNKKIGLKLHKEFAENNEVRLKAFGNFKEKNFPNLSTIYKGFDELSEGAKNYSAVVTGSDQLWSPAGLPTNFYNLMFVPDDVTKVSYASSFGVGSIPWYQKKRTKAYLERMDFISMREMKGAEIVKKLTGKDVLTILDPVFMLDFEDWNKFIPPANEMKEKYIFAYFLGANEKHRQAVQELASKTGLKIVTLRHLDQYVPKDEGFGDFAPYDVAPDRFLNFIRNAEYVCTDSFHGACFSIINKKKFMIFNRYDEKAKHSKNSRIESLCEIFGLSQRRFNGRNIYDVLNEIDYDTVHSKLSELKMEADNYLNKALGQLPEDKI